MKIMKIIVREPKTNNELEQYYDLRWRMLREPLGMPKGSEKFDGEENFFHFIALNDDKIVGTGMLVPEDKKGKVRQIAVDPKYQGQGIGSLILSAIKEKAIELEMNKLILNARKIAAKFYEKNGFKAVEGSDNKSLGVPHIEMELKIKKRVRA